MLEMTIRKVDKVPEPDVIDAPAVAIVPDTAALLDELRRCRRLIRSMFSALCDQNQDMEAFEVDELAKARFGHLQEYDEYTEHRSNASYQETTARRYLDELKGRGVQWNL